MLESLGDLHGRLRPQTALISHDRAVVADIARNVEAVNQGHIVARTRQIGSSPARKPPYQTSARLGAARGRGVREPQGARSRMSTPSR